MCSALGWRKDKRMEGVFIQRFSSSSSGQKWKFELAFCRLLFEAKSFIFCKRARRVNGGSIAAWPNNSFSVPPSEIIHDPFFAHSLSLSLSLLHHRSYHQSWSFAVAPYTKPPTPSRPRENHSFRTIGGRAEKEQCCQVMHSLHLALNTL